MLSPRIKQLTAMTQESNQKGLPAGAVLHDGPREYEIIKVLGEGSFGVTYLAWLRDSSAPGQAPRQVAVKEFFMHDINGRQNGVVTSSVTDGMYYKYMRKFKNEASALNRLHHENIVHVHSCFEANNTVYYSMEFLNGGSIDDVLADNGPLPQQQVLKLAAQVASALSYLHSSNMLHLDLKPSNIMLRDQDHVALIDFGLAKQFDDSGNPESSTTIGGGTPGYAPIEQQNSVELANFYGGKSSVLPVTMDIYAFGATLYKMLVGKMPPMPDEILDNDVLPPQCLYERQVSPELIQVLTKAMKPRKKDRYQSVAEMYDAFKPMLQPGEEVKIWTPAEIKRQKEADVKKETIAPVVDTPATGQAGQVERDGGTIVAGAGKQKTGKNNNQGGNVTEVVDSKKKKNAFGTNGDNDNPFGTNGGNNNPFGTNGGNNNPFGTKPGKEKSERGGGSKKGLIIGICAVLLIAGCMIAYMLTNKPAEPVDNTAAADNTEAVAEATKPEEPKPEEPKVEESKTDDSKVDDSTDATGTNASGKTTKVDDTKTEPTPGPQPQSTTRSVLGGKAMYDTKARTITFSAPYSMRVGDSYVDLPAGAVLTKVALHPNGRLRSCGYNGERFDGLNVAL